MEEAGISDREISQKIQESGGLKTAMLDGNLDEGIAEKTVLITPRTEIDGAMPY